MKQLVVTSFIVGASLAVPGGRSHRLEPVLLDAALVA